MNEQEYKRLAQICDKILLDRPDDIYRIAISWLHVFKEHPSLLAEYENLHKGVFFRFFSYFVWRCKRLCRDILLHAFSSNWRLFLSDLQKANKGKDLLILSHLMNIQHYNLEEDFYFGKINADLDTQFLLRNHTPHTAREIKSGYKSSHSRIILPTTMNPFVALFFFIKGLQQFILIFMMGLRCKDSFERSVMFRAAAEAIAPATLDALRVRRYIGMVLEKIQPKAILTPYEGHSYPRLIYQRAKQHNPAMLRLAYRHSAIWRLEYATMRALNTEFNPDYILTAGEVGYNQFKKGLKMQNCDVAILGSPKKTNITKKIQATKNAQDICLLLPEAIPEEYTSLFAYIVDCAALHTDIVFIFRFHPRITEQQIEHLIGCYKPVPPNIKISSAPIEEDIARAKWAVYRGSTSIIQACAAGVIPIYHMPDQLHVDVLYEISEKVPKVSSCEDFSHIVKKEYDISDIVDYCKRFYSETDYSVVQKIIENGKN